MIAPSKENKQTRPPRQSRMRLLVCGATGIVVLILASAVYFGFTAGKENDTPRSHNDKPTAISEAQPVKVQHKAQEATLAEERPPSNIPPEQQVMHTNMYGYVINRPHTAVVITKKMHDADKPLEERVFTNSADQKIAGLLLLEPGEMLIGDATIEEKNKFPSAIGLETIDVPEGE